ncbi:PREDICTED: jasmonic acid-amido synthetase JAR1 [Tarenaya hassleriana]|uniref:jasmonic acid-amido synthetase JAR1 n=1 Tax=Tarenaya hassleriana TaxID=28532 RepID=UPI00053C0AA9|nr:PREDICTED: jasmonic acid-amido synthetase JAR1 [Tarenaya hassleriana]XP_010542882.1 PREDICTED: jasmonic acid-amido synthetase JAR1 [Tarenaya hassleriana]
MELTGAEHEDVIAWFEYVSENASRVQSETLRRILELNSGAEYLRKWLGTANVQEMDASALENLYTSSVPIASYADLEPYIQRISDGETSPILTQEPITVLSLSSGTTEGRKKYVPFTRHSSQTTLQIFRLSAAYRSRVYPIREGGRILEFIYASKEFKTRSGLKVGTATTHYYASKEFKTKQETTKSFTCSPREVILGGDFRQCTYCHLLLGLYFSGQVEFIASAFAYTIVQAFAFFEEIWRDICDDIKEGGLSSRITLPRMRNTVLNLIRPNPSLASRIEAICLELQQNLGWSDLIPKLWPNAKYVSSIMTGSMLPYLKKLRHYAGSLPLVSADYGSTESWIGVNVDPHLPPEDVSFTVIPTFCYFEFIPLYRQKKQDNCSNGVSSNANDDFVEDKPVPLSQVKLGEEYEVVITTFTGLYRYRLGDVVEVTGFHKGTPKLSFIYRRKLILTINIDKITEKDLQRVVDKASQLLSRKTQAELVDFTSHADVSDHPGHYVIYWEIRGEAEEKVLEECCREMDKGFVDHGYVVSRRMNGIGPLELRVVERGTFGKIAERCAGKGGGLNQFKTPRCTTNTVILKILDDCTVQRLRSTSYD